jgi:biopolymer transport protein ExbD
MIDRTKLLNYVLQEAVKDPQPEIHIRADRRVRYEYVAEVLFSLQRGGLMKIGFIAEPPGKGGGG